MCIHKIKPFIHVQQIVTTTIFAITADIAEAICSTESRDEKQRGDEPR